MTEIFFATSSIGGFKVINGGNVADLFKEEYQMLRKEVEVAMSELNQLELVSVVGSAGVFSWLATNGVEGTFRIAWLLPAALVAFCILRAWTILRHLGWLGDYLTKYEAIYLRPTVEGWEHFLKGNANEKRKVSRRGLRGRVTMLFWAVLFAATTVFGLVGYIEGPATTAAAKCVS